MNWRRSLILLLLTLLALAAAGLAGGNAAHALPCLDWNRSAGDWRLGCLPPPAATSPSGRSVAPYPAAPACPSHDPRAYHGLWDARRGCHYDHTHGDDPRALDGLFGIDYYGRAGGEISYPWQTSGAHGLENEAKHQGYFWVVRQGQPCRSDFGSGCVTDFRAQFHFHPSGMDTPVRYHSFAAEMRLCPLPDDPRQSGCGYLAIGGWQDTGDVIVDSARVDDVADNFNRHKLHYFESGVPGVATWYQGSPGGEERNGGLAQVAIQFYDMWDYTDPADVADEQDFICYGRPDCRHNGATFEPHVVGVGIPPRFRPLVDGDGDGLANYSGYVDRYGALVSGCRQVGLDCVPLVLRNVRTDLLYQYRGEPRDYDIYFDDRSSGWLAPLTYH